MELYRFDVDETRWDRRRTYHAIELNPSDPMTDLYLAIPAAGQVAYASRNLAMHFLNRIKGRKPIRIHGVKFYSIRLDKNLRQRRKLLKVMGRRNWTAKLLSEVLDFIIQSLSERKDERIVWHDAYTTQLVTVKHRKQVFVPPVSPSNVPAIGVHEEWITNSIPVRVVATTSKTVMLNAVNEYCPECGVSYRTLTPRDPEWDDIIREGGVMCRFWDVQLKCDRCGCEVLVDSSIPMTTWRMLSPIRIEL